MQTYIFEIRQPREKKESNGVWLKERKGVKPGYTKAFHALSAHEKSPDRTPFQLPISPPTLSLRKTMDDCD